MEGTYLLVEVKILLKKTREKEPRKKKNLSKVKTQHKKSLTMVSG
jgi:hypothetical protein